MDMTRPLVFLGFLAALTAAYLIGRFHAAGYVLYAGRNVSPPSPEALAFLRRVSAGDVSEADDDAAAGEAQRLGLVDTGGGWAAHYQITRKGKAVLAGSVAGPAVAAVRA